MAAAGSSGSDYGDGTACCPEGCTSCGASAEECRALGLELSSECCLDVAVAVSCDTSEPPCTLAVSGEGEGAQEALEPVEETAAERELRRRRKGRRSKKKRARRNKRKRRNKKKKGGKGKGGHKKELRTYQGPQGSPDPYCNAGFVDEDVQYCCPQGCSRCSNALTCPNFSDQEEPKCCGAAIAQSDRPCDRYGAPCILNAARFDPKNPGNPVRNARVGVWLSGDLDTVLPQREDKYGIKFDSVVLYQTMDTAGWDYVASVLDKGVDVELVMEFMDNYPNLRDIANGKFDSKMRDFGKAAAADGRRIYLRPLHELNSAWYNWGVFRPGNSVSDFRNAFKRIVSTFRSTGANFKYQMSFAAKNSDKETTPFEDFYVGDEYVDQVCVSAYNSCGTGTYRENKSLPEIINTFYWQMQAITKRTMCIAEMSSTNHCGGKATWIKDTWATLARDYPKIVSVNWFFEDKMNVGKDWDLHSPDEISAFVNGYHNFESITKRRLLQEQQGGLGEDDSFNAEQEELQPRMAALL
ncbi:glycoside hydrolase superfamily [Tribonema minus]|uniref:Glycoside hydrolase superfamily n=1 Tax=Tribonema minus TaxID=303371 RepID=A0A836CBG2_9STRA|nr:glycoside hydrolase superfamily [Tribonema minus]